MNQKSKLFAKTMLPRNRKRSIHWQATKKNVPLSGLINTQTLTLDSALSERDNLQSTAKHFQGFSHNRSPMYTRSPDGNGDATDAGASPSCPGSSSHQNTVGTTGLHNGAYSVSMNAPIHLSNVQSLTSRPLGIHEQVSCKSPTSAGGSRNIPGNQACLAYAGFKGHISVSDCPNQAGPGFDRLKPIKQRYRSTASLHVPEIPRNSQPQHGRLTSKHTTGVPPAFEQSRRPPVMKEPHFYKLLQQEQLLPSTQVQDMVGMHLRPGPSSLDKPMIRGSEPEQKYERKEEGSSNGKSELYFVQSFKQPRSSAAPIPVSGVIKSEAVQVTDSYHAADTAHQALLTGFVSGSFRVDEAKDAGVVLAPQFLSSTVMLSWSSGIDVVVPTSTSPAVKAFWGTLASLGMAVQVVQGDPISLRTRSQVGDQATQGGRRSSCRDKNTKLQVKREEHMHNAQHTKLKASPPPTVRSKGRQAQQHTAQKGDKTVEKEEKRNKWKQLLKRVKAQVQRIKQEEHAIGVFSADGWRGSSREKVRLTDELQRAEVALGRAKETIRECVRVCDEDNAGQRVIPEDAFDEEGEVDAGEILCSVCDDLNSYDDNDIIMCDGCCNRAFHEQCCNPVVRIADLAGDEGWLCASCDCKVDILNLLNDEFGCEYEVDTPWTDVLVGVSTQQLPSPQAHRDGGGEIDERPERRGDDRTTLMDAEWPSEEDDDDFSLEGQRSSAKKSLDRECSSTEQVSGIIKSGSDCSASSASASSSIDSDCSGESDAGCSNILSSLSQGDDSVEKLGSMSTAGRKCTDACATDKAVKTSWHGIQWTKGAPERVGQSKGADLGVSTGTCGVIIYKDTKEEEEVQENLIVHQKRRRAPVDYVAMYSIMFAGVPEDVEDEEVVVDLDQVETSP
ncbi:hypothetical protein CEUSTIGMA_g11986.t1 [Chlamydomonas eustigma]|uniref:PHD-type domain-containing protein n=1 Tax=Chlamydomonas eustigma TaxID=1157962 RepID=A0A250XNA0_9CHLO|nr:hypothetical protein CEUSTIGMA_g11986.t1 [Chlamydomonas eustigma]|eukprot:GAX84565.1 hypothetical protein CEUSTIGMA_g11986.t1 [Chlamydomonas eustigma]